MNSAANGEVAAAEAGPPGLTSSEPILFVLVVGEVADEVQLERAAVGVGVVDRAPRAALLDALADLLHSIGSGSNGGTVGGLGRLRARWSRPSVVSGASVVRRSRLRRPSVVSTARSCPTAVVPAALAPTETEARARTRRAEDARGRIMGGILEAPCDGHPHPDRRRVSLIVCG